MSMLTKLHMHTRKCKMHKGKLNNAGFSLVEVLVAMAVLSILSIPVLSSFSNAARINHKARREENANTVASDIVEQFKSVSMRELLDEYAGKYTTNNGKYEFKEVRKGANGEDYTLVTELEPGMYNAGDDSDKNYNNNINSYVNSVKNIVLREDLYSYDSDAETYFKGLYQANYDKNMIQKTTNVKIEIKHSELTETPTESASTGETTTSSTRTSAVDNGVDSYYQRITVEFEYVYNGNTAYAYKPQAIVYPNNYFKAETTGANSYRISSTIANNLKDVYMFYIPYDRHSIDTVENDNNKYYGSRDKINISYSYPNSTFLTYDNCNVFIIQQTVSSTTDSSKNMVLERDNIKLRLNNSNDAVNFSQTGTINLGTNSTVNGKANPGPVSVFSNIYGWEKYKDVNSSGSGDNSVASKSLLYTMTVKVYYGDYTNKSTDAEEPIVQMTTTKIG